MSKVIDIFFLKKHENHGIHNSSDSHDKNAVLLMG